MDQKFTPALFLNPDLVAWLVGYSNEALVIMDGQETTSLIDSGAQVSSMSIKFCEDLMLQIQPLGQLLELEGTEGAAHPIPWVLEVNLQIMGIRNYNEDVLLLVIATTTYSEIVPVMVGSKIIDKVLSLMTMGRTCEGDHSVVTGSFWSSHVRVTATILCKFRQEEGRRGGKISYQEGDPMEVWRFCLDDLRGLVHTTWKVTILPFSTVSVHANSGVKGHCMWVHVLMELMPVLQLPEAMVPMVTYGELHQGSSRVPICLHNLSAHAMEIPTKAVVGQVFPANQVPLVVHLTRTTEESKQKPPKRLGLGGSGPPMSQRVAWIGPETGQ